MNSPADWTASALFSPSKARAQQAQAKDWAFVEAWLAKRYGKRIPTFERNEDTLQALLTLATLNENADEQRVLIEKVEKTALQATAKRAQGDDEHYGSLLNSMGDGGCHALSTLAESAVLLGSSDTSQAAENICVLTAKQFELAAQVQKVNVQHLALQREHARLQALLEDLSQDSFSAPSEMAEQTAEWTRSTKHMKAKITEYEERLGALRSAPSPSPSVEEVKRSVDELQVQRTRLSELSTELSAFESLPADTNGARTKLENTRTGLRTLTTRRDGLFEALVDSR
ncbi:hypothetical protein LTR08_003216 [Meristemomyces frigidus]|nr:hypothetical protein LTR08_003216 [Meristemomyces frigidus]